MSVIAKKEKTNPNDPQSADWVHLIRLLKILVILFVSFSCFHWIILKKVQVQSQPVGTTVSNSFFQKLSPRAVIYTVKEGDTLWKIAFRKYPGSNPQEMVNKIKKINQMKSDSIKTGQPLRLP